MNDHVSHLASTTECGMHWHERTSRVTVCCHELSGSGWDHRRTSDLPERPENSQVRPVTKKRSSGLHSCSLWAAGLGWVHAFPLTHSRACWIVAAGEDTAQPLQNLAINGAAVAVFGFLLRRDLQASERDKAIVRREESLGRLQVRLPVDLADTRPSWCLCHCDTISSVGLAAIGMARLGPQRLMF